MPSIMAADLSGLVAIVDSNLPMPNLDVATAAWPATLPPAGINKDK